MQYSTRRFETISTTDDIGAYSINDPRGATSKAKDYPTNYKKDLTKQWVTKDQIQGMPRHSAYVIKSHSKTNYRKAKRNWLVAPTMPNV